jgi:hypothetical protein
MHTNFIDRVKRMIKAFNEENTEDTPKETSKETPEESNSIFKINKNTLHDNGTIDREKLRNDYETFLDNMEKTPVDEYDPNVQKMYSQACNFLALQTFRMMVSSTCADDPGLMKDMTEKILKLFFGSVKHTLFRKLEINELIHDNKFSKNNLGEDLIERFNKCNNNKISKAINMTEDLIKKSLQIDEIDENTENAENF